VNCDGLNCEEGECKEEGGNWEGEGNWERESELGGIMGIVRKL